MQITEIKRKSHSKNIYLVYVDNSFFAQMLDESIVKFNLKSGQCYEKKFLENAKTESLNPLALHHCLNVLDRSIKTKKQILGYLKEKGFEKQTDFVIEKLEKYRLIDDVKYAEAYVSSHKNRGKKALWFELKIKGVDEEIIKNVLSQITSQEDVIFLLAKKFLKNKTLDAQTKQKLFRHLANKGFEFDEINACISQIFKKEK